jgi:hypothetical protein
MSIVGDDGITLPKISKCADIKRKKNPSHRVPSLGVFYVVIAERIQDKQFKKIPDPHQRVVSLTQKIVSKLSEI